MDESPSSEKSPLIVQLTNLISEISDMQSDPNRQTDVQLQTNYQRHLARLCYILEKILDHGLKGFFLSILIIYLEILIDDDVDINLFGSTHFWNYIEQLNKCLPGPEIKDLIRRVKECGRSSVARGRIFIRIALNEGLYNFYTTWSTFIASLSDYLRALIWNKDLTRYHSF
jgi:hypothetical protein